MQTILSFTLSASLGRLRPLPQVVGSTSLGREVGDLVEAMIDELMLRYLEGKYENGREITKTNGRGSSRFSA